MVDGEILKSIQSIQQEYKKDGLLILGIFGSYARGEENKESDIDILYEIKEDKKISIFQYLKYLSEIEKRLNHKVDLVRADKLKPDLKPHIYKELVYV